jgi:hypothetical protein
MNFIFTLTYNRPPKSAARHRGGLLFPQPSILLIADAFPPAVLSRNIATFFAR